jgi:hypothetical protein
LAMYEKTEEAAGDGVPGKVASEPSVVAKAGLMKVSANAAHRSVRGVFVMDLVDG